jgi:hypothetical protein
MSAGRSAFGGAARLVKFISGPRETSHHLSQTNEDTCFFSIQ